MGTESLYLLSTSWSISDLQMAGGDPNSDTLNARDPLPNKYMTPPAIIPGCFLRKGTNCCTIISGIKSLNISYFGD